MLVKDMASFKWAIAIQKALALPIYRELWPEAQFYEADAADNELAKVLDFGGVDKLIHLPYRGTYQLANRFRRIDRVKRWDMTFRISEANRNDFVGKPDERFPYHDPNFYAYGIVSKDETRFEYLYLFDCPRLFDAIRGGRIKLSDDPVPNPDGTGFYYTKPQLRELEPYTLAIWKHGEGWDRSIQSKPMQLTLWTDTGYLEPAGPFDKFSARPG